MDKVELPSWCPLHLIKSILEFTYNGARNTVQNADTGYAPEYSPSDSFSAVAGALNSGIATALSIIPLSSPASGAIVRTDPATGAELPESSTLGPIFTERAETIGKGRFYIGFSHQDFHFTSLNGTSLNALSLLSPGNVSSNILRLNVMTVA
jgi:hypothetical protein